MVDTPAEVGGRIRAGYKILATPNDKLLAVIWIIGLLYNLSNQREPQAVADDPICALGRDSGLSWHGSHLHGASDVRWL